MQKTIAMIWALVGTVAIPAAADGQTAAAAYKDYRKSLEASGYSPIVPASSLYSPGYVYRLVKTAGGEIVPKTLCAQLFDTPAIVSEQALPTRKVVKGGSFKLALNFLPDFLAKAVEAAFGIDITKTATTDLNFEGLILRETPEANVLSGATGKVEPRQVNPLCYTNLRNRSVNKKGKFVEKIYVVLRSSEATKFTFAFDQNNKEVFDASASAAKIASAKIGWSSTLSNKQNLVLAKGPDSGQNIYFAADIVRLESIAAVGQIDSSRTANLELAKIDDTGRKALAAALE